LSRESHVTITLTQFQSGPDSILALTLLIDGANDLGNYGPKYTEGAVKIKILTDGRIAMDNVE
jgi:hypothetical protein